MSPAVSLSTMGHGALALAARGYRVFPCWGIKDGVCACPKGAKCDRPGKHPSCRRGLWEGTTDAGRVTSWWLEQPEANVGIRTGVDLFVVDIDGDVGRATWARLCKEWGVPVETTRVFTGGGGEHLYFRGTGKTTVAALGKGVDTRGEGGYVLAPPSLHASGRRYTWDPDAGAELLADAPEVILAAAGKPRPAPEGSEALGDATYVLGGRNKALTSVAGALRRRGLDAEALLAALLALNAAKCRPPLDEPEVKRIALSIARYPVVSEATAEGDGGANKAVRLLTLLEAQPVVLSPTGRFFAEIDGAAVPLDGSQWSAWASAAFHKKHAGVVSSGMIKDCTRILQGRPQRTAEVPLRVGERDGIAWLDLGPSGAVPLADCDDDACPPAFHRPSGTGPLEVPEEATGGQALEQLRALLGLEQGVWVACLAWLLAALRPAPPYPVLVLQGEAGSGKSTLAEILRGLLDPRCPEGQSVPRGGEALRTLAIQAEHSYVLAYDNISGLDGDLSDAFCRLATGDGFSTRSLYSDRDLVTFQAARPIIFTSVIDAISRPDLLDRALLVTLPPRLERADPARLKRDALAMRAAVLGALVWATRIAARTKVEVPGHLRMAPAVAWGEAGGQALGLPPGAVTAAFLASKSKAQDLGEGDPMVEALLDYLPPGTQVRCTYKELLSELTHRAWDGERAPNWWPREGKALQSALNRHAATLRGARVSVEVRKEGHDNTRYVYLRRGR